MDGDAEVGILLVEDHASFRAALDAVMLGQPDLRVVAQVGSVAEAGEAAARTRPRVALVDLDLPDGSGAGAILDIHEVSPDTACVVLSALVEDAELGRAVEAGAAAVLHKSIPVPDLLQALRTVAAGGVVVHPVAASRWLRALASARNDEWEARLLRERLTPREHQILDLLAQGLGHQEIAAELVISPETAQTHIRNLLGRMKVGSRLGAVVKGLRLGLVEPPS